MGVELAHRTDPKFSEGLGFQDTARILPHTPPLAPPAQIGSVVYPQEVRAQEGAMFQPEGGEKEYLSSSRFGRERERDSNEHWNLHAECLKLSCSV